MLLSTGMATIDEIDATVSVLRESGVRFGLMNCVSEYPPVYEDMNLGVIPLLRERYPDLVIGHSDHTPDLYTSFAAVALGAHIVEKHIILDKRQPGPDQAVSIDMRELSELVDGVRKVEAALGRRRASTRASARSGNGHIEASSRFGLSWRVPWLVIRTCGRSGRELAFPRETSPWCSGERCGATFRRTRCSPGTIWSKGCASGMFCS